MPRGKEGPTFNEFQRSLQLVVNSLIATDLLLYNTEAMHLSLKGIKESLKNKLDNMGYEDSYQIVYHPGETTPIQSLTVGRYDLIATLSGNQEGAVSFVIDIYDSPESANPKSR